VSLKIEETFDELGLLATSDTLDASHQTQTRGNTNDSFCIIYIYLAVLGVSFEAVQDEIDSWCFVLRFQGFLFLFFRSTML